ncbi:FGGY family carbohydrate kinase [Streptomyces longwoodensis]|uniref:FGGY family carbohydrate kinase n=1 Tax=Streptomyces longwoodensis TaxID=68231 RepID=UPI0038296315
MTDHAEQYVAAIDQGTTSSRCIIFDREGVIVAVDRREHRQIVPQPGWVEHDAAEIWAKVRAVVAGALARAGLRADQISALGITNQRETTVLWDRVTGKPVHNAIVRQDTRTAALCAELGGPDGQDRFRTRTGLPLVGCFSGPKAAWLLDRVPGLRARAERGEIAFGTVDSWLVWNLTGGTDGGRHVTDVTNAGRTLLMDLETLQWDPSLLSAMDVPEAVLPEIRSSAEVYGTAVGVLDGVPVAASLGDQQAALFGQACYDVGTAKNTYGTGSSLLLNTGDRPVASKHGLLTTVGYRIGGEAPVYCLEGSLATTDALVTREVVDAMQQDSGVRITTLKVDGGMTSNDLLMQHQADVLGVPVVRPRVSETTCLGAAYAAGLATGVWSDLDELAAHWQQDAEWTPAMEASVRDREYHHWRRAVERSFGRIEDGDTP